MAAGFVMELPKPQILHLSGAIVGEFPATEGAGVCPFTRLVSEVDAMTMTMNNVAIAGATRTIVTQTFITSR